MKDEIRYKLKVKRKYFQGVRREVADKNILYNFIAGYGAFQSYFVYNSFGSEASTALIINYLLATGKTVYLPRVEGENIVPVPYGETKKGTFGVFEPVGRAYSGDIDVTVVPLLAVNERGFRIGYGKGYYDGFLKNRKTLRIGLGYSLQIEEFQEDIWYEPLDEFLTEKGIYDFGK